MPWREANHFLRRPGRPSALENWHPKEESLLMAWVPSEKLAMALLTYELAIADQ